jgi:hypothetical protein
MSTIDRHGSARSELFGNRNTTNRRGNSSAMHQETSESLLEQENEELASKLSDKVGLLKQLR